MRHSRPQSVDATARIVWGTALAALILASGCLAAPRGGGDRGQGGPRRPDQGGSRQTMDMAQTLSEGAQLHTLGFSAVAFLTGSLGADSFFPPGKVADWWGFQYLRDNDASGLGHNTDFLTRAASNMLYVLRPDQRAQLVTLAQGQVTAINQYAYNRFPLMQAFRRLLEGQVPNGAPGLSKSAVEEYSAGLYRLDGQISLQRAQVMGAILHGLSNDQRAYLDKLRGLGMANWPDLPEQIDKRTMSHDVHVAVMTYAGDLFAWYVGDIGADVYFCPERQGTYFGGFYMKDAPAMGNPNYTISNRLTGDMGEAFVALLSPQQAQPLHDLVSANARLLDQIVQARRSVATELRKSTVGEPIDTATVLKLCEQYGRLDGDIVWGCATVFAQIARSLTEQQRAQIVALRRQAGSSTPQGAYLYSTPIPMPAIPSTDYLFGAD